MLLESAAAPLGHSEATFERRSPALWGAASETGRLTDVLLSAPIHLSMVPCNAVTRDSIARGLDCCPRTASRQHRELVATLERADVRCHFVPPVAGLPDLTFTRDAVMMSPWGLIELHPSAPHRAGEPRLVAAAAASLGVRQLGRIEGGDIEGGDVCLLRDGILLIGYSGLRTNETGARAVGRLFEQRGWEVIYTPFAPEFLHLDTIFTMLRGDCAVALKDAFDDRFFDRLAQLGIGVIPTTRQEVERLGANILSLGGGRVVAPRDNEQLNLILERSGFEVLAVEVDQLTRCGGGIHCLTMPLARRPDREGG